MTGGPPEASFEAAFRRYQAGAPLPYREFSRRVFGELAALESECAALTDALTEATHDWRSSGVVTNDNDCAYLVPAGEVGSRRCSLRPSDAVHRTPARVRAEHGFGAT